MSVCLLVHPCGRREQVVWEQRAVSANLGGAVTFVGALDDLCVVIVGVADAAALEPNALAHTHPWLFLDCSDVRGPVVFVASDDKGDEMDVDVRALEARLNAASHRNTPRRNG